MEQFWGSSETKRIYGLPAKSNFFPMEMIETCIPEYERVHRTLVDLLEKGLEYNLEFEIRPYNGTSPKYISSIATVELNEEGHPEKVIGFMQDITERKHSEKELQTSKDKFEKAFNHTPDIIIISHLETGKIYEVNQTFVTTLGYRREEVIGKSVFDINLWPNVNDRKDFAYTLGKNGSIEGKIYSYRTKNGASIIVQIHASLVRIDNEMCILSIAADITGERALEIENQKFINVLDQSINEIHVFNLDDFHFSYVNKASLSALGYAMEEMKALTPVDITKGVRSLEELKQTLKPLIDKEKSRLFMETEHIRKDGTTYPIETQVQIVEFDNIRQVIATSIDISDKIRSRDELKQSQENYKLLAENALDLIWKMNMELEFTYANPSVEMILGYRVEEFVGSKLYDHCSSEEFAKMQTLSLGMLSSNSDQGMSLEAIMHKKDGTEVVLELNGKLIFDDAHNPIGFQGSARDFTAQAEARKKLSDALASLEKKSQELQTILQEAPNPIMLHNEDGEVLMVNKVWETLTGYSYTEINTIEKWAQKACNNKNQLLKENIEKLYSLEQKINMGESTITTKEGNSVIWQFSSAPLGIINGKRTVITSAMDITELKKKDELMMAQSRHAAMGEMIGMIAHQWRQPIAGIAMDANNMLLDIALETFDNTAAEGYAQDILDQTKHLSKTIDDFRNFFKPDKSVSAVKLADIMNETLAIVKESLANNAINLKTSYTSESQVDAYPRELMQVFVNIINNARDALTSDHTKDALIEIKIYDDEEYVNTEICDNGGGIDETILAKLFDPYFSTKDEKTGTGLGLYMSKMIIEEHLHGIIEASNNKDKGACFTVRLLKKNDHNSTLETDDK
jgi:PAS domain S-box-containing protein